MQMSGLCQHATHSKDPFVISRFYHKLARADRWISLHRSTPASRSVIISQPKKGRANEL